MPAAFVFLHVRYSKNPAQRLAWPPPAPDPLDRLDGVELKVPILAVEQTRHARRVVERLDREFQCGNFLWGMTQWFSYVERLMLTAAEQRLVDEMDTWISDAKSWGEDWIMPILRAAHDCVEQLCQPCHSAPPQVPEPDRRPVLLRNDEIWTVRYEDRDALVIDMVGLGYVAYLLSRPNEEVSVAAFPGDVPAAAGRTGARQFAADEDAIKAYARRLQDLNEERAAAGDKDDLVELDRIDRETDAIRQALRTNTRLGGALRPIDDEMERTRQRVTKAIDRAIDALNAAHPQLGAHLEQTIKTGSSCCYRPNVPISWRTDFSVES